MDELKPCPFCNGTHSINVINFFTRDSYRKCDICGAEAPEAKKTEEAAKVWNTRPAEDALKAELDKCKKVLSGICFEKSAMICKFAPESCKVCQIKKALKDE